MSRLLQVLLDDKLGTVWDISELVTEATWKTTRAIQPGSLDFRMIASSQITVANGNIVRVKWDDIPLFYGYVFSVNRGQSEEISVKCYDQMRYLNAKETYVFKNITAAAAVKRITDDVGLKWGHIADTKYVIPTLVGDGKKLLDILSEAFDKTVINTGIIYTLYDEFGALAVRDCAKEMKLNLQLGDQSLLYSYSYEQSIDSDTYNYFKLVQDNQETGHRDVYAAKDEANIATWGKLIYYDKVDDNQNAAQINKLLDMLQKLKNRETRRLKLDVLGQPQLRAGCLITVNISALGMNQEFLIDECSHQFRGGEYTTSIDLKVI